MALRLCGGQAGVLSVSNPSKEAADWIAGGAVFLTIFDHLPAIAAGLGAIWYLIRFYEYFRVVWLGKPPRRLE